MNRPLPLIDSHCHLDFPEFDADRQRVIETAGQQGIEAICIPGTEAACWDRVLQLTSQSSGSVRLHAALGVHPWFLEHHNEADLRTLESCLQNNRQIVAVGEIGLDFAIKDTDTDRQQFWFMEQLELARQFDLPVILHVRKAHDQVLKQLRHKPLASGGIIHAFSGSEQQAYQYIEKGFCLGFAGSITYPRASKTRKLAASLPLSSIVLETDAPDMPLSGFQGQRNEPAQLVKIFTTLAELRQEAPEEIAAATRQNTQSILDTF